MTAENEDRDAELATIEAAAIALSQQFDHYVAADVAERLSCDEVEALADLFRAVGRAQLAKSWLDSHTEADDEPTDRHYCEGSESQ